MSRRRRREFPTGLPKKVLLIASNFPPVRGGSASVYANLARCLRERMVVLAPKLDYADGLPLIGWREYDRNSQHKTKRLPLLRTELNPPTGHLARLLWRLDDLFIRGRVLSAVFTSMLSDRVRVVCIGELISCGWITEVLRFLPRIHTVAYVHGEEITTADQHDPQHRRARRYLLLSDHIVVVSSFTREATRQLMGPGSERKISLIQNGVDNERFYPESKPTQLEHTLNLDGKFVFLSVCRLVKKKGLDTTIRAFSRISRLYPDCRLLLVGSGPYREVLGQIVVDNKLGERVLFCGSVSEDELLSYYHLGDVFVMPNRALPDGDTEGFGLVFLEANACGLPVIAGRDGGSTEAVQDGYNGLVVNGNSVEQIADAMIRLRCDLPLRSRLRENGLERAERSDWKEKARLFLTACTEL